MRVTDFLKKGKDNAITGAELSNLIGCETRVIEAAITRERREGAPICATNSRNPGYYLAADAAELQRYCDKLRRRTNELNKTRAALQMVLDNNSMI